MRYIYLIIIIYLIGSCSASKQTLSNQEKYVNKVFNIVEKHSIRKDSVDFDKIKSKAYEKVKQAKTIEDCYPIIQSILRDLGDNHSFLMTKERVEKWKNTSKSKTKNELITFSGKNINDNIGYLKMNGVSSGDKKSLRTYADSLQNLIKTIDNKNIQGWIIDLRENTGGNCWPMLAGIGPIIDDGVCGYFMNGSGRKSEWFYEYGESGINSKTIVKTSIKPYELLNRNNPIAILTGNRTASSGEVIVTAFHGKENTKSFGKPTAGLSTGNRNFRLSDGSMILLTSSIYSDRNGKLFGKEIKPDIEIEFTYDEIGTDKDKVIEQAIEWINK
ncbi:S41 family peptidase [Mariniflexile litorale]|uniref:S41 family peptidase n=1 Tax=Mariniflexile litorale TaxID=3045158 RepID=A0AAU7EE84_9FLAO|nr:S41 family peptidase [Mariniflexile sp. KMM 9835]MDQ8213517.1 S41 family peptidase [Mariniflexile sp. KMM 9835]